VKFEKALTSDKIAEKIQNDFSDGSRFGVQGTPTFFLNGQKLTLQGPQSLEYEIEKARRSYEN
jgi:protein-disulfide isomerase